nr:immunoglobulin heavy chain junction region [Macaca mulatta]MOW19893.1 immunoglobulin heavy chain junction region [Macaca mulatta]MOW22502.1 immunoglobulin heavy chain junction region [Macaca mulatta]
CAGETSVDIFW